MGIAPAAATDGNHARMLAGGLRTTRLSCLPRSQVTRLQGFLPGAGALRCVHIGRRHAVLSRRPRIRAYTAEAPPQARKQADALGVKAGVHHLYRRPAMLESALATLLRNAQLKASPHITAIDAELCYNIELAEPLTDAEGEHLSWLLRETYEPDMLTGGSYYDAVPDVTVVEVGPRKNFATAWAANAASICMSVGLTKVTRLEASRRFGLKSSEPLTHDELSAFAALVHDRMTEEVYLEPLDTFASNTVPGPVFTVPVVEHGRAALEAIDKVRYCTHCGARPPHVQDASAFSIVLDSTMASRHLELGLAFDDWDLDYYTDMFQTQLQRDPTNVELFDIAQSNSEHSRHWFFKADLFLDGEKTPHSLFDLVKAPLKANPNNSVIGFHDNSSAIRGGPVTPLLPQTPGGPSALAPQRRDWDLLLTAETHNFPCAVAPYPGAETGAGGRIRDTHATGVGSMMGASTAGYCVGNLHLEGYRLEHEVRDMNDPTFQYPEQLASPAQILVDASNGASDYGNKFGEPLIAGYTRTFGQRLPSGERWEWIKPIMFSGGIGQIDHAHLDKLPPEIGMLVVKIGGPAYRIGMGGGAASSVPSGSREGAGKDLDFNAVQRGDAEMAQKLWRVVRACVELGPANPIQQIHDQGAGGNCNVVKEIIYPLGAEVNVRNIKLGDETMSVLEIWGAEYQENDCILIKPEDRSVLEAVCKRERCLMQVLGSIDGSGRIRLVDPQAPPDAPTPVDLELETVLGSMPNKTFRFSRTPLQSQPLILPEGITAGDALDRVMRLPAVGSKRFLTNKVDRCVTGLVAQQQCVGPLQLPLADVAVVAQSHFDLTGTATSIGEQPYKGLLDPAAMARMALGEALTNLMWARATALADVKASVNWMYAAKLGSEGAAMYDAAVALKCGAAIVSFLRTSLAELGDDLDAMLELGMACDGGKDSLSMAASAGGETVKAPGNLVVSAYVTCPDITATVTPNLKLPGTGRLVHVDLAAGRRRLGGSNLAQAFSQIGHESPDVEIGALGAAFAVTQRLLEERRISAGHDISDGGIAVALLEMAFAGNTGITADVSAPADDDGPLAALFAEELGLLLEVKPSDEALVVDAYRSAGLSVASVGSVADSSEVSISVGSTQQIAGTVGELRDVWEATSFQIERLQAAEACVNEEQASLASSIAPSWHLSFTPRPTPPEKLTASDKVRVAIIREEGSNGDREMSAAVYSAGMEPWDITMSDLLQGRATLDFFQGVVFVGGFSYADVLDSAKGWAGTIRFSDSLRQQFQAFYSRPDTFSLGICNGCQLMALLGWVPGTGQQQDGLLPDSVQPRFIHNRSGRFESRWVTVAIREGSPAIMLKGMGGSRVGVWCAHGEGRAKFPDAAVQQEVLHQGLAPVRYCDAEGNDTEMYPFNPNGSPEGIAALCSPNGRHLAMMPHPERCFLAWQNPWMPPSVNLTADGPGPWLQLFQNAREWAESCNS